MSQPGATATAPAGWHRPFAGFLGIRSPAAPQFLESAGSADPLRQIAFMHELGFAGVCDNRLRLRPADKQQAIGRTLERLGMRMGSFVHMPSHAGGPTALPWARRDAQTRALLRRELVLSIEAAQRCGGDTLVVVAAEEPDVPLPAQLLGLTDNLREMAPLLEAAGVRAGLEPACRERAPGVMLRRLSHALEVVMAVSSDCVGLVFDNYHMAMEEGDEVAAWLQAAPHVLAVQLSDAPGRIAPGAGSLRLVPLLKAIEASGFTAPLELEFFPTAAGPAAEMEALATLHRLDAAAAADVQDARTLAL